MLTPADRAMKHTVPRASAEAKAWTRVARDLTDDLAADAPERDRAGKPPLDEVARIRESDLLAALAPPGPAGRGTQWKDACSLVRQIAAADSSIAELLGRHYVLSWSGRFFMPPGRELPWEARAIETGWLWAGDTGPGTFGGSQTENVLTITPADRGYVLSGHRPLATGVSVADRLILGATCIATGESHVVVVDPTHSAITVNPLNDRLGQRLAGQRG